MSSYGRLEEGAVPGARDRETGPVGLYRIGFHGTSRALNRTEREARIKEIDEEHEAAIAKVNEAAAQKYLAFMREMLAPFKTHNHVIWINAGMGSVSVKVGTAYVSDYRHTSPLIDRLQEIDQFIEGQWDWACCLDGERLNGPAGNVLN